MSCLSSLSHAAPWPADVVDHGGSWIQPLCGMNLLGARLWQVVSISLQQPMKDILSVLTKCGNSKGWN